MRAVYAALWGFLASLVWTETLLIRRARRVDPSSVALRERQIASVCRATSVTIGGILGSSRMLNTPLPPRLSRPLLSVALSVGAIPAARFLYLYWWRGFR